MLIWWQNLTFEQVLLGVAVLAALAGIGAALATPSGRERLALLGLRIADALVALLEKSLSEPSAQSRRIGKGRE